MDTGIIGSVTVMKRYTSDFGPQSATVHGLVVSAILIPAAISSFFAGRVADVLGRPKAIAIGALIFGLGAAFEAGAVDIAMFVLGRIIAGFGEGVYLGTLVVQVNSRPTTSMADNEQLHLRNLTSQPERAFNSRSSVIDHPWSRDWIFYLLWNCWHGFLFRMAHSFHRIGLSVAILCSRIIALARALSTMVDPSWSSIGSIRSVGRLGRWPCGA